MIDLTAAPPLTSSFFRSVYVAGPMAGQPFHGYPAFDAAAAFYRSAGFFVLSPRDGAPYQNEIDQAIELDLHADGDFRKTMLYAVVMRRDIQMVLMADAVVVLPGWEDSKGASLEVQIAQVVGTPVFEAYSGKPLQEVEHARS